MEGADGEGQGLEGGDVPHAEGVHPVVDGDEAVHGADGEVGSGSVASAAGDGEVEAGAPGHHGAVVDGDGAGGQGVVDVAAVAGVDLDVVVLHPAVDGDDVVGAFLASFEHDEDAAFKLFLVVVEDPGRGQQRRHVAVVSAGVADALVGGYADLGPLEVVLGFVHRQGVAVGAQQDGPALLAAVDIAQDAAVFDDDVGDAEFGEQGVDVLHGLEFPGAGLCVDVEVASFPDHEVLVREDLLHDAHRWFPFFAFILNFNVYSGRCPYMQPRRFFGFTLLRADPAQPRCLQPCAFGASGCPLLCGNYMHYISTGAENKGKPERSHRTAGALGHPQFSSHANIPAPRCYILRLLI